MYSEIINYAIRSTACLAFFYVFYNALLRNETCFKFNRGYLLFTLTLSFVLPLLNFSISLPGNSAINPDAFILPEVIITDTAIDQVNNYINIFGILNIVYISVVFFLSFRLIFRMYKLWKVVNSNRHLRENKYIYEMIPTNGKLPTSSFLNYLFWDNTSTIDDIEKQQIIAHEKVHILERHTYDILLIEFLSIIFWFNPFLWIWKRVINENHEFLADSKAANGASDYAELLARHTLAINGFEMIHPFKSSEVIKRLQMLSKYGHQTKWVKLLAVIPLLLFMIFTMSFSVQHIMDKPYESTPLLTTVITEENEKSINNVTESVPIQESSFSSDIEYMKIPHEVTPKFIEKLSEVKPITTLPVKEPEEVFTIVEESAQPVNGMEDFYKYVSTNLKYPKQARKKGIEGRVFIQFVVDKYGNLTEIETVKGIGAGCDAEAMRVINSAPHWKPGKQRGKAVQQRIVLPITFKLG